MRLFRMHCRILMAAMSEAAETLISSAYEARKNGRTREAILKYREAAAIYRELDCPLRLAHTIRHIADLLREEISESSLDGARLHYEEALDIYRSHPEARPLDLANALRGFALLWETLAASESAMKCWCEAKSIYELAEVRPGVEESEQHIRSLTHAPLLS
jgi:tetratricopeptide (TPR) repeat protein